MRNLYKKILVFLKKKKQEKKFRNNILTDTSFKIITCKYNGIILSCLGFGQGKNLRGKRTATWKNEVIFNETKAKSLEKFFIEIEKRTARTGETISQIFDAKILNLSEDVSKVLKRFKLSVKPNKVTLNLLDESGTVIFKGLKKNVSKYTDFVNKSLSQRRALIKAMNKRIAKKSNKYDPENALAKGYGGIPASKNGASPDFDGLTEYLYKGDVAFGKVRIKVTGARADDFRQANQAMGLSKTPKGYTWHHVDDLDEGLECTIQLVKTKAHQATTTHIGSANQFQELLNIIEKYL